MKFIVFVFTLLLVFNFCKVEPSSKEKFDTSDNNPIAYCLRQRNGFTEEQILKFLIDIQDPEKAVALFPYGGKLSNCVKKRIEETKQK